MPLICSISIAFTFKNSNSTYAYAYAYASSISLLNCVIVIMRERARILGRLCDCILPFMSVYIRSSTAAAFRSRSLLSFELARFNFEFANADIARNRSACIRIRIHACAYGIRIWSPDVDRRIRVRTSIHVDVSRPATCQFEFNSGRACGGRISTQTKKNTCPLSFRSSSGTGTHVALRHREHERASDIRDQPDASIRLVGGMHS
jgi:hypothetical protein